MGNTKKNLAYCPSLKKYRFKNIFLKLGDNNSEIRIIKNRLNKIGYKCSQNNYFDLYLKLVIEISSSWRLLVELILTFTKNNPSGLISTLGLPIIVIAKRL